MTTASSAGAPIVAQGVTKDYGEGAGIHELDLVVPQGTILGVVGPSGAGKTTTIRILTGAVDPEKGDVRVLGEDPRRFRRATRERIGYMPQLFTLYPDLTAEENVDFVASLFGMLWRRRRRRVGEVLRFTQLIDAKHRRAANLSGGMQRRLELACALVHEPDLLFLDEPTAGIDPILRQSIWEELHRLKGAGRTLLVTTQYVTEAEECDSGRARQPRSRIEITERGTAIISGRSDATINRGGIRMGTSEIYRAVLALDEVLDALVLDLPLEGTDGHMPLFVVLREGIDLDDELAAAIRRRIREDCSPRHVPDVGRADSRGPEHAVREGARAAREAHPARRRRDAVVSRDALANPAALEPFEEMARRPPYTLG